MRARARAALIALIQREGVDRSRVASIGFCFGGTVSLELARSGAEVLSVMGFHSGLSTTAPRTDANAIRGRILVCIGADDPFISEQERLAFQSEMRDGGVDWQMHLYGKTVHSFTDVGADKRDKPEAMRYSAAADAHSWAGCKNCSPRRLARSPVQARAAAGTGVSGDTASRQERP